MKIIRSAPTSLSLTMVATHRHVNTQLQRNDSFPLTLVFAVVLGRDLFRDGEFVYKVIVSQLLRVAILVISVVAMFLYTKVISISISTIFMSLNSISFFFDTRMRCYSTWLFSLNQFIKTYFSSTMSAAGCISRNTLIQSLT
jgi:hypothetical protein